MLAVNFGMRAAEVASLLLICIVRVLAGTGSLQVESDPRILAGVRNSIILSRPGEPGPFISQLLVRLRLQTIVSLRRMEIM